MGMVASPVYPTIVTLLVGMLAVICQGPCAMEDTKLWSSKREQCDLLKGAGPRLRLPSATRKQNEVINEQV